MSKVKILDGEERDRISKKLFGIIAGIAFLFLFTGFALGLNGNFKNISGAFLTGDSIVDLENQLNSFENKIQENDELIDRLQNSELKEQELMEELDYLKEQNSELREGIIDIINQVYREYSNLECPTIRSSSSSSSCSCPEVEETEETEICELTSDGCGEDEYLDAEVCKCISRKPPITDDDTKITVSA